MNQHSIVLDIVKNKIRLKHYYIRAEEASVPWIKREATSKRSLWGMGRKGCTQPFG